MNRERPTSEQPVLIRPDSAPEADTVREPDEVRPWVRVVVAVVVAIVLVLIVFALLRRCTRATLETSGGSKEIESVEGARPNPGMVSVWLVAGTSPDSVLAGLPIENITDTGGGRLILGVQPGTEASTVARLKRRDGVHDAGFVYGEPGAE